MYLLSICMLLNLMISLLVDSEKKSIRDRYGGNHLWDTILVPISKLWISAQGKAPPRIDSGAYTPVREHFNLRSNAAMGAKTHFLDGYYLLGAQVESYLCGVTASWFPSISLTSVL
jgi:hypothetical protein